MNVYAEEMTDRVEIVEKVINGVMFTGLRIYTYMPVTKVDSNGIIWEQVKGPFINSASLKKVKDNVGQYEVDDDSSAVTFWGKSDLRDVLWKAIDMLSQHYKSRERVVVFDGINKVTE